MDARLRKQKEMDKKWPKNCRPKWQANGYIMDKIIICHHPSSTAKILIMVALPDRSICVLYFGILASFSICIRLRGFDGKSPKATTLMRTVHFAVDSRQLRLGEFSVDVVCKGFGVLRHNNQRKLKISKARPPARHQYPVFGPGTMAPLLVHAVTSSERGGEISRHCARSHRQCTLRSAQTT